MALHLWSYIGSARGFGVRIEDDILITKTGNQDLTAAVPKTAAAIEAAMVGR